jgi:hypothetical protein
MQSNRRAKCCGAAMAASHTGSMAAADAAPAVDDGFKGRQNAGIMGKFIRVPSRLSRIWALSAAATAANRLWLPVFLHTGALK